ncbi:hypothetical protein [Cupriavidus necator]|nr:hypothetical protein [Cupriavidus necator]
MASWSPIMLLASSSAAFALDGGSPEDNASLTAIAARRPSS